MFSHQKIYSEYFEILRNTLTTNNLTTSPRQIYNCDETFLPMNYTREKVVAAKGAKNVYSLTTGASDHISLLCCVFIPSHSQEVHIDLMALTMPFMQKVIPAG